MYSIIHVFKLYRRPLELMLCLQCYMFGDLSSHEINKSHNLCVYKTEITKGLDNDTDKTLHLLVSCSLNKSFIDYRVRMII